MAKNEHHDIAFDEGTQRKLFIYKSYLQAWLQVFIHTRQFPGKPLHFFDLFSGPGTDGDGNPGSPIILMQELETERDAIIGANRNVKVFFNDYDEAKAARLQQHCVDRKFHWQPTIDALDFSECYKSRGRFIGQGPSLVFLDQFGVKFVTRNVFCDIASRPQTDLLFFFASGHQRRLNEIFSNDLDVPADTPFDEAHRVVASQFRGWAPSGYYIGHFSIKKGSNIYGLIFGSRHALGMYKFLNVAWSVDPETGEADFRIEADCDQADLLSGFKPTKLERMHEHLIRQIKVKKLCTDGDVVLECITNGVFPGKVVPGVYKQLRVEKLLKSGAQRLRYSYDAVTDPRSVELS